MNNTDICKNNKIVLGISGGVDSTTAALLLLEKGFDVYGLYFSIKTDDGEKDAAERALFEAYKAYGKEDMAASRRVEVYLYASQEMIDAANAGTLQ